MRGAKSQVFHRFESPAEYSLSVIISVIITLSRDTACILCSSSNGGKRSWSCIIGKVFFKVDHIAILTMFCIDR